MTDPDFKMLYLGTAQLLVETHNQLVNTAFRAGEEIDEEHAGQMEAFIEDFNAADHSFVIQGKSNKKLGIFTREQIAEADE